VEVDVIARSWCRACGRTAKTQLVDGTPCPSCGVETGTPAVAESRVGLVFSQRRKLVTTRKGICVADTGDQVTVHFSAKEPAVSLSNEAAGEATSDVAATMSPAGRLFSALQHQKALKADWVEETVRAVAGSEAAGSIAARRILANEALQGGWTDIFDWIDLSATEKTWIAAHQAAATGDLEQLLTQLGALPSTAYDRRVDLILPYLSEIAADSAHWLPMVSTWSKSRIPGAAKAKALLSDDALAGVQAGIDVMTAAGWTEPAERWESALRSLAEGRPTAPPVENSPSWTAAAAYATGVAATGIDDSLPALAGLATPLLDDLVDSGALSAGADLSVLPRATAIYIGARLSPGSLNEEELRYVDHIDELARRLFIARDRTGLQALEPTPTVEHYLAMLDVIDGKAPDPGRLDPSVLKLLDLVEAFRRPALDSKVGAVPKAVIDDPTLWPTLATLAQRGIVPSPKERDRDPSFASWCDLQRVVGLLWSGDWNSAAELGQALAPTLAEEAYQDEALNLTAFALRSMGRSEDALQVLERALEGDYTEPLLVNTSILACEVEPVRAMKLLVRIVDEAPSGDLKLAAVRRAIAVWEGLPDRGDLPTEISRALGAVLQVDLGVDDYYQLTRVAAFSATKIIQSLPAPTDARRGPYLIAKAQASWLAEREYSSADLVRAFVAVYREFGHTYWFDREWEALLQVARDAMFVDFGDAMVWAVFWDTVNSDGSDLMSRTDRLVYLPQSGAHMAAYYAKSNKWLAEQAFTKFFFLPAEEVLNDRAAFEPKFLEHVIDNLARTLSFAGFNYLSTTRELLAVEYNDWVDRLRRDAEHRYQILGQMRDNLTQSSNHIDHLDRVLDRLQRLPLSADLKQDRVTPLVAMVAEWRKETISLRAQL
jgi:hypothetical protein